jgi:LCP family protein required for cell wall assembly
MSPTDRSVAIAVGLSAVWPGLGQWYSRRWRIGLIFAVPIAVLLLIILWSMRDGLDVFAARLLVPTFAMLLLIGIVLAGAIRLVSMAHAYRTTASSAGVRGAWVVRWAVLLGIVVVAIHAYLAFNLLAFFNAGNTIYGISPNTGVLPFDSPSPGDSLGGITIPSPQDTPQSSSARINVLLVGADSGLGYNHALTDTLIVVSVDPVAKTVAMLSLPRDTAQVPMYNGGTYNGKINSLMTDAQLNPKQYPDGPLDTLKNEVGYLVGLKIHYVAFINLAGFQKMVDAVGGVDVNVLKPINDPGYEFPDWLITGKRGFFLTTGMHHLNGRIALAFVRSRMGAGDNDFTRAARQQQILIAIRQKLTSPSMLTQLPDVLNALAGSIRTDMPPDQVPDLVALSKQISDSSIKRYVLGPPYAVHPPDNQTGGVYILKLDMARIAKLSIQLFGSDSRYYTPPSTSPSP